MAEVDDEALKVEIDEIMSSVDSIMEKVAQSSLKTSRRQTARVERIAFSHPIPFDHHYQATDNYFSQEAPWH